MLGKFEKFEEWMIGKKVKWEGGEYTQEDEGFVIEECIVDGVPCVVVEWTDSGEDGYVPVSSVEFIEFEKVEPTVQAGDVVEVTLETGEVVSGEVVDVTLAGIWCESECEGWYGEQFVVHGKYKVKL